MGESARRGGDAGPKVKVKDWLDESRYEDEVEPAVSEGEPEQAFESLQRA